MSNEYQWRAPKTFNWRIFLVPAALVAAVALTAAITAFVVRSGPPPAPPPRAAATARPLTPLETTAINWLLGLHQSGAHKAVGTIAVNGHKLGVQISYTDDAAAGSGSLTAGPTRGDALLDHGATFVRGDADFLSALGVSGPVPAPPFWINAGDLLQGKLFYSSAVWTAALAPTPEAKIDGNSYSVGPNSATILNGRDITHYAVNGVDVSVSPVPVPDVVAAATALGANHGPGAPPAHISSGGWQLPAAPPPDAAPPGAPAPPKP
jgi:hypothetical protein